MPNPKYIKTAQKCVFQYERGGEHMFDEKDDNWENSDLKKWLNQYFLNNSN